MRNSSLSMRSLVRGQWTCHVVVFVDITLGYRIPLTQHNTDTAFLCMVFGLFALKPGGGGLQCESDGDARRLA